MRNWSSVPGTRAEMWVKTRSSHPKRATRRYAAARSTRTAHSSGETLPSSDGISSVLSDMMSPLYAVKGGHVIARDLAADAVGQLAQVLVEVAARVGPHAVR